MKPSRFQLFVASGCPFLMWLIIFLVAAVVIAVKWMEPTVHLFRHWSYVLPFLLGFVLLLLIGFLSAIVLGLILLAPLYHIQGLRNGGPFKPGDLVQIIAGRHAGRVAKVYSGWQWGQVRVELGEEEKAKFKDIYYPAQVLRYTDPEQLHGEATSDSAPGTESEASHA